MFKIRTFLYNNSAHPVTCDDWHFTHMHGRIDSLKKDA